MNILSFGFLLIFAVAVMGWIRLMVKKVVLRDYEVGLLYRNGKFVRQLQAGAHYLIKGLNVIEKVDKRVLAVTVPGQEILTKDNVAVKVSIAVMFEITDAVKALHKTPSYLEALYLQVQLALRGVVNKIEVENLLEGRVAIGTSIQESVDLEAEKIGLSIEKIEVKDITFSHDLKQAFSEVIKARKEGLATLEKARGESAALRNLANAAKVLEKNPDLLNLRILKTLEGPGNTFVVGASEGILNIKTK